MSEDEGRPATSGSNQSHGHARRGDPAQAEGVASAIADDVVRSGLWYVGWLFVGASLVAVVAVLTISVVTFVITVGAARALLGNDGAAPIALAFLPTAVVTGVGFRWVARLIRHADERRPKR